MRKTRSGAQTVGFARALPECAIRPDWKRQVVSPLRETPSICRSKGCDNKVLLKRKFLCEECREWRLKHGKANIIRSMQSNTRVHGDKAAKTLDKGKYLNISDIQNAPFGKTASMIDQILKRQLSLSG